MNAAKLSIVVIGILVMSGRVSANVGDQVVDGVIPFGTATLDGDLSEWAGAVWRKADQPFTPTAPNLTLDPDWDPEWTARWSGDTIYVAVRVVDNTPFHTDSYLEFPASDRLEIYSRGSGIAGSPGTYGPGVVGSPGYEPAQQYFVGITDASLASGGTDSWGTLGPTEFGTAFPEDRVLVNDGSDAIQVVTSATDEGGGTRTLIYEVAVKQYNSFDATSAATSGTGLRTLAVGDTVGFAVAPGSRFDTFVPGLGSDADFAATVSAGGGPNMFANFDLFGLYQLVTDLGDFDADTDIDGFDFLQWQRGESPLPLNASDLSDWEGNFGATSVGPLAALGAGVDAVPEPSAALLTGLLGLLLVGGYHPKKLRHLRCEQI